MRLIELGASAGLNLRWDRFFYLAVDGASFGDPASPLRIEGLPSWPSFAAPAAVSERQGCDRSPLDATSSEGELTLKSFVWADQVQRLAQLEAAISVARKVPVLVEKAGADEYLAARLTDLPEDRLTVVFHSVVWLYLTPAERTSITGILETAGQRASHRAPLAWLRFEAAQTGKLYETRLTTWPERGERLLACAGAQGRPVWYLDR